MNSPSPLRHRVHQWGPWVIGLLIVIALIMWMGSWTGEDAPGRGGEAIWVLINELPWVVLWLAAALGLGWPLRVWLLPHARDRLAMQAALGIAVMLILTAALGRIGVLQAAGSIGTWMLIALPCLVLLEQLRRLGRSDADGNSMPPMPCLPWLALTATPAAAVLLLAACSAPGWLWDSEFGGYDVLSYHLQLPKEWLSQGAIVPLEHNVYSHLPNYLEGAFYHLAVLKGDAIDAAYACQLLHAAIAIIAAGAVGRLTMRLAAPSGRLAAAVAGGVLALGTPWVIVTGSLAYSEMAVVLMLTAGLLVLREAADARGDDADSRSGASNQRTPAPALATAWGSGAVIGVLAAAACGAKLTAIGLAALPLGLAMLVQLPRGWWLKAFGAAVIMGAIGLSPYLIGNAVATGNPVFPFATGIFGTGHWTQEQVEIWYRGHIADLSTAERVLEGWNQLMRYGIGPRPDPNEPWHAHWSILPWLGLLGLAGWLVSSRSQRGSPMMSCSDPTGGSAGKAVWALTLGLIAMVQIVFWLSLTHIKSRFMLPFVVPAAILAAVDGTDVARRMGAMFVHRLRVPVAFVRALGAIALVLWSLVPVAIFADQTGGAPAAQVGAAAILRGDAIPPEQRRVIGEQVLPPVYLNHLMPPDARVLMIGKAAPLYYDVDHVYQTTWDRGPLSHLMRTYPDEPQRWMQELRDDGFTHILLDAVMLDVWERSGWNDPMITADAMIDLFDSYAFPEHIWPERGMRLYHLGPR